MRVIGVIPARYASTRFPGKPLADIHGKPMIWWVYQQALKVSEFDCVVIATDDERIANVCRELDMRFVMTSDKHPTPTDRIAEVADKMAADIFVVIMGDEPLIAPDIIRRVLPQENDGVNCYVAATVFKIANTADVIDTDRQKVTFSADGRLLWASRFPIPFPKGTSNVTYYKQSGVIAVSRNALKFFANTERGALERAEENDLLRFLENGVTVYARVADGETLSVDSCKDLETVKNIIAAHLSPPPLASLVFIWWISLSLLALSGKGGRYR